jgi:hypothetical protein
VSKGFTHEIDFKDFDKYSQNLAYYISILSGHGQKEAANIIKPMLTRIYQKKYVNGSENLKGHKNIKNRPILILA